MKGIHVPYVNLGLQHEAIRLQLLEAVERVLKHGAFILGPEVRLFEERFAAFCGSRYAIGVDNGTSALILALRAVRIGPGDEVITVPNSFLASASCIALVGAKPVFVDVRDDYNINPELLERAITPRTKAIIPVHLTGRPADLHPILEIAYQHNLHVIEDCAQAVGARYHGKRVGSLGTAGCFSLHPLKNLNAAGDAGVISTDDVALYEKLCKARNHGLRNRDECEFWSPNCRLDTIQAAMLLVKMEYLHRWTEGRRKNALFYQQNLRSLLRVPEDKTYEYAIYHTFVVQAERRNALMEYLLEKGVESKVHYPVPIHLQMAAKDLNYGPGSFPVAESLAKHILSLPIYPELSQAQLDHVVSTVQAFYRT